MKTSELTGVALDWAVSVALGHTPVYNMDSHGRIWAGWWERTPKTHTGEYRELKRYSTDWAQGGPIIEREAVHLFQQESTSEWTASLPRDTKVGWRILRYGATPLIAAMRCYVASKLGDNVEIPQELM